MQNLTLEERRELFKKRNPKYHTFLKTKTDKKIEMYVKNKKRREIKFAKRIETIKKLRKQGIHVNKIGHKLGICGARVSQICRENSIIKPIIYKA